MNDNGEYKALYVNDDYPSGVILVCEKCEEQFTDKTKWGEQCTCPSCGVTLRYPEGAEW